MRRRILVGVGGTALLVAGLTSLSPGAGAAPPPAPAETQKQQVKSVVDDLPSATEQKRRELRKQAVSDVLTGKTRAQQRGSSTVVKMGQKPAPTGLSTRAAADGKVDQYVELGREATDKIFVVLTEFGNERHPDFPDEDTDPNTPGPVTYDGPLHNQIPEPDRSQDNSTNWTADYSREHYEELYFSQEPGADSLANFYEKQSSGRYSVDGMVTDWVKVKYNQARYGRSGGYPCPGAICNNVYALVADGVTQWYQDQIDSGRTPEEIAAQLAEYDVWDRSDYDGDGNFDEPDGYIDHFQIVHAGGDEANADPIYGEDAIWSHRSFAYSNEVEGPDGNLQGGVEIGGTGIWVGDYTMQPENGGLSVFAHEYGHDLGLPDLYDTAGGDNHVNWWSLMAQSRVSAPGEPIGLRANDLDPWSKLQLGWLDYEVAVAGQNRTLKLGPHEYNTKRPQGVVVVLPDKEKTFDWGDPFAGENQWWSEKGDDLNNTMTRTLDLTGRSSAALTLKARYDIEADFDYLYAQVSTDGGETWTSMDGTVNGEPFVRDSGGAPAVSGSSDGEWVDMNVPLDQVAGQEVQFRFRYSTDGAVSPNGFFADNITFTADGEEIFSDGAESGDNGWELTGFRTTTGHETIAFDNFYIASHRTYQSYGKYMKTGPYNFGFPERPNWVEHFAYENGLLVWYWDTSMSDNNTSQHPGEGLILPIDSHPKPIYNLEGQPWRSRIAGYDAPFKLVRPDSFTLHINGKPSYIRGGPARPLFDDTRKFWFADQPWAGVKLPGTGTTIRVMDVDGTTMKIRIGSKG